MKCNDWHFYFVMIEALRFHDLTIARRVTVLSDWRQRLVYSRRRPICCVGLHFS